MQPPLVPESALASPMLFKNSFEKALTYITRFSLITTCALAVLGIGGQIALYYFEENIDKRDSNPHGNLQKNFKLATDLSWLFIKASFYIGLQTFLLSQIINLGHFFTFGTGAIQYRHVFYFN